MTIERDPIATEATSVLSKDMRYFEPCCLHEKPQGPTKDFGFQTTLSAIQKKMNVFLRSDAL
jgi:hypothetical protein